MKVRVRYHQLDLSIVPEYGSPEELKEAFEFIRDTKFLTYKGIERKIPWLFVKEFCHVRAQHAINELEAAGYIKPQKIFLHGILNIENKYFKLKEGEMIWQHIAPIVKLENEHYVLDPAINNQRPLTLHEWISSMTTDYEKIMVAVCSGDTYIQSSSCYNPDPNDIKVQKQFAIDTEWALRFEWNVIKNKGDDPVEILLN